LWYKWNDIFLCQSLDYPETSVISKNLIFNLQPKDMMLKRVMSSIICESVFDIFALFEVLDQLEVSLNDKVSMKGTMEVFHHSFYCPKRSSHVSQS
jgi:hypothetical protein